ncbi:F-box protein At1g11270-like [Bidens hawaiensis]|uniref:F-box protein At1g11270-like n=1 Tax=Bidens hawaiensis TaxID=980011 RepID=UPI00404AAB58
MEMEDIIYGILSRLPIKSLARFRCVCKLWLKYIDDPYLRTIHVKEEPQLIMFQPSPSHDKIKIRCGVQKEIVMELFYKGPRHENLLVGNACIGLTLVCYERDPCEARIYRFALINHVTKQRHDLPPLSIRFKRCDLDIDGPCDAAGIGFDDSTNTLKTVFVIVKNLYRNVACTMVHSSGTSSWRKLAQAPPYIIKGGGVFGHGRLHWLAYESEERTHVVWFDLKTEEFGLMDPPKPNGNGDFEELVGLNDTEVGFAYTGPVYIKLWMLKQDEEWVLHCCFDQLSLSLITPRYNNYYAEVLGFWNKDGDILLACDYHTGDQFFVYTPKSGHLREINQGDPCSVSDFRMCQSSLFSLHVSASLFH